VNEIGRAVNERAVEIEQHELDDQLRSDRGKPRLTPIGPTADVDFGRHRTLD
jgi:hypothetical protein